MKITTTPLENKKATISDLKQKCIEFLENHGVNKSISEDFITEFPNQLMFSCNCANDDFTIAFAMLQLIVSTPDHFGIYISYTPESSFIINVIQDSIQTLIDKIDKNFNFKIEIED